MAVLLGSVKRKTNIQGVWTAKEIVQGVVYKYGKPYKEGVWWAQDIVVFIDGEEHRETNYAYKKSVIEHEHKNYPYLKK